MKIAKQRYRRMPIAELKPHPRNPRTHDIPAIRESIEANGFVGALVVQRSTGYILAGHGRLEAAVEEDAVDLPVLELDVDDETALRILLADNRTSDRGGYEDEGLLELLRGIGQTAGTLEGTGWTFEDFKELEAELDAIAAVRPLEAPEDVRLDRREAGVVELALGGERLTRFLNNARRLADEYGTSELSDTVFECLERATSDPS